MKCSKARRLISFYVTGDLDYGKAEAVKEHVITCEACSEEAESYRESLQTLKLLKDRAMPAEFWDGYADELRERMRADTARGARTIRLAFMLAAAAVVLLALLVAWPFTAKTPAPSPEEIAMNVEPPAAAPRDAAPGRTPDAAEVRYAADRWDATYETARAGDF